MPDNSQISVYYQRIAAKLNEVTTAALAGELPATVETGTDPITRQQKRICTAVYIVSLDSYDHDIQAGRVVSARPAVAAERIVQGTHALASAQQVQQELERQANQKTQNDLAEMKLQKKQTINVRTVPAD